MDSTCAVIVFPCIFLFSGLKKDKYTSGESTLSERTAIGRINLGAKPTRNHFFDHTDNTCSYRLTNVQIFLRRFQHCSPGQWSFNCLGFLPVGTDVKFATNPGPLVPLELTTLMLSSLPMEKTVNEAF